MDMHQLIASQVTSYKLQVTSYKLQVTSYKLQVTSYKLQVTSYKLQVTKKAITDRLVGCVPAVLIRPTENH